MTELRIRPDSVSLVPGVSVQLHVSGTTRNGRTAPAEQLEELDLVWSFRSEDDAFTVDEPGCLTALSPGTGNAMVRSGNGTLSARAITVFVK